MSRVVTISEPTPGLLDDARGDIGPTLFTVQPGKYDVEDLDDDLLFLVVDDVPDVCVIVTRGALGLVECVCCGGRGSYSYRVSEDEWDTDECGDCEGVGAVTPEVAAVREAQHRQWQEDEMRA